MHYYKNSDRMLSVLSTSSRVPRFTLRLAPAPRRLDRRTVAGWRAAARVVADVFAVPLPEIAAEKRSPPGSIFARQVAMYLANVACGITFTDIGHLVGRDRSTVASACALVEDERDDPSLDRALAAMESALRGMLHLPVLGPPLGPYQLASPSWPEASPSLAHSPAARISP